jgi:sugar lactone lactonase YvrE
MAPINIQGIRTKPHDRGRVHCGVGLIAAWSCSTISIATGAPPTLPGATAEYRAWVAARLPGNPEGLAVDESGRFFAGVMQSGEIVRLDGKGGYELVASVPDLTLGRAGVTLGLEFGRDGQLYVAYVWHYSAKDEADPFHMSCRNSQDVYTGVYRVNVRTRSVAPFLTKHDGWPVCFPDDITFDAKGNAYVTDLTLSGIWKISPDARFSLWSTDPLLQWGTAPHRDLPEGANDLVISKDQKALYVVTDGNPAVVKVPIKPDGSAGVATSISRDLTPLDGVELDERGNIYVTEPYRDEVSVFSPDGNQRIVIATADTAPITNPTSLAYHDGILCMANTGSGERIMKEPRSVTCISGFNRPH